MGTALEMVARSSRPSGWSTLLASGLPASALADPGGQASCVYLPLLEPSHRSEATPLRISTLSSTPSMRLSTALKRFSTAPRRSSTAPRRSLSGCSASASSVRINRRIFSKSSLVIAPCPSSKGDPQSRRFLNNIQPLWHDLSMSHRAKSQLSHHLLPEPVNRPRSIQRHQPDLPGLPRLKPHRGTRGDVEAHAPGLRAVELQGWVGLEEMVMAADLDRPVAGVGDGERHGLAAGVELDVAGLREDFAGDHGADLI